MDRLPVLGCVVHQTSVILPPSSLAAQFSKASTAGSCATRRAPSVRSSSSTTLSPSTASSSSRHQRLSVLIDGPHHSAERRALEPMCRQPRSHVLGAPHGFSQ